jgi:hypothetical protein
VFAAGGSVTGGATGSVAGVSTRRLILAALLCGMAILVAFAVQVVIAT